MWAVWIMKFMSVNVWLILWNWQDQPSCDGSYVVICVENQIWLWDVNDDVCNSWVCGTDGEQCACSWYCADACDWHVCWLVRHDERQGLCPSVSWLVMPPSNQQKGLEALCFRVVRPSVHTYMHAFIRVCVRPCTGIPESRLTCRQFLFILFV